MFRTFGKMHNDGIPKLYEYKPKVEDTRDI